MPDRLGVAVESAASLLRALRAGAGDRAAVVAFAGRGVVRCPLTSNLEAAVDVLRSLQPGEVQPGGTDLGAALDAAIGAFDEEEHAEGRTIVVFSDGEDHVGSWPTAIERLRSSGIVVHSIAIGDPDRGHPVPSNSDRDRGVETRRSDVAFESMSKATGGAVIPLGLASADLGTLFRDRIEPTARGRRDDFRIPERVERFPAFLLAALGFGLAGPGPARLAAEGAGSRSRRSWSPRSPSARGRRRELRPGWSRWGERPTSRAGSPRRSTPSIGPSSSIPPPRSPATTPPRRSSNSDTIPRRSPATKKPASGATPAWRSRSTMLWATPTWVWERFPRRSPAMMPA